MTGFADVLLPLPVPGSFTYSIPGDLAEHIVPGMRVVVQFGSRKIYAGLVLRVHDKAPEDLIPKEILSVIDETPVVNDLQFFFWEWLSSYYLCTQGEVMNAALPTALKLSSESKIVLIPGAEFDFEQLNEKEQNLVYALENRNRIPVSEVPKLIGQMKALPVIKTLIDKRIITMEEDLQQRYRPKKELFIRLNETFLGDEKSLQTVFDQLEKRAPRQLDLLMTWIQLSRYGTGDLLDVPRKLLVERSGSTAAQLERLVEKGIFDVEERLVGLVEKNAAENGFPEIVFTPAQAAALDEIRSGFEVKNVVLLHGVTSSGKTEIYVQLIRETLAKGKQVLYLLPEIALTTQIITRLRKYFGKQVGIYHSRFSDNERVDVWKSRFNIILGARSAIFLPFINLGLIIVDEEHDTSFKQMDPAPRYNGRDAAIYLARMHGAKTLLGSATPSVESYFNVRQGKYALVELNTRYGDVELPLVEVVNVREEFRKGTMKSHFSPYLLNQIETALQNREQSILFQNRRGFSLRLECDTCQWMPACKNCDVTLVYHKKNNQLKCHYCGFVTRIPETCPECHGNHLIMKGFGTEKVEEELSLMFPAARIARMDLDTTRTRNAHQQIIGDFESGKIDILVGTQMVTKGLDFDRVSTVCVLNADNMLSFPDFRAAERSFQLMAQVSGRSGRRSGQGKVIIQTFNSNHPVIRDVINHDYVSMFNRQISERKRFNYPPFCRLVLIKVKHRDLTKMVKAADICAQQLRIRFGNRVLGPEFPLVARIMNYHIKHILLKFGQGDAIRDQKNELGRVLGTLASRQEFSGVRLILDIDPV